MVQYGFYYDNSRCTGCKTCVMACKDYKDSALDVAYRKVYDLEGGTWEKQADDIYTTDCLFYHLSMACNHCDDPACVSVCPTTAMHKEGKRGLVLVDETKCVGCGYCVMACPYNAPNVVASLATRSNAMGVKSASIKVCSRYASCRVRCVRSTLSGLTSYARSMATRQEIHPMPSASYTHPNITIKPSPAALDPAASKAHVANPKEVQ